MMAITTVLGMIRANSDWQTQTYLDNQIVYLKVFLLKQTLKWGAVVCGDEILQKYLLHSKGLATCGLTSL